MALPEWMNELNALVVNTTCGRCVARASVLIEAGIKFRFELIPNAYDPTHPSYCIFVREADRLQATQRMNDEGYEKGIVK